MKRNDSFSPKNSTRRRAADLNAHPPPRDDRTSLATLDAHGACTVAEPAVAGDAVDIGSTIVIRDLGANEREEYTLVPPDDADILHHRISTLSPIGRALFGRRVGEIIEVDAPSGKVAIRIEQVRRHA
jgi:transcription elongation GreA/GreB family factor